MNSGPESPLAGLSSASHSDLLIEFLGSSAASQMMIGDCGLMAPLARVTALMKTRAQNWPLETDAEIPVFVLVFAIRETGLRATNATSSRAISQQP